LVLALALSTAPSMAPALDTGESLAKQESASMVAGRKAVEAKDFRSAVGHFTKAVNTEPKNTDAYSMLGYSYRKTGTFDKSLEFYQKALKLDAHHRGAREYLGELYLDMNQPDNAEKQLAALKKDCSFLNKCEEYEDLKKALDAYKAKKK
jgi:Flp pilus assembly protein TadD